MNTSLKLSFLAVMLLALAAAVFAASHQKKSVQVQDTRVPDEKYAAERVQARLTPIQYEVTQKNGTEPAFRNEYWDHHDVGLYVDIVSGEPLFSSLDKYDSNTGWPSFTKPLVPENIVEVVDMTLGESRIEIRSKHADSHLGHVFNDGPDPLGLRYCLNSAALRFVPYADLEREGYGEFLANFSVAL